ncbi:hypothetical protein ON010_g16607 [Phytophthora cinnamomi]|nr:hypothetical protein ON010_g16607 [Phytophthora cinnamomi]
MGRLVYTDALSELLRGQAYVVAVVSCVPRSPFIEDRAPSWSNSPRRRGYLPLLLVHGHFTSRDLLGLQQTLQAEEHGLLHHLAANTDRDLLVHRALAAERAATDLACTPALKQQGAEFAETASAVGAVACRAVHAGTRASLASRLPHHPCELARRRPAAERHERTSPPSGGAFQQPGCRCWRKSGQPTGDREARRASAVGSIRPTGPSTGAVRS